MPTVTIKRTTPMTKCWIDMEELEFDPNDQAKADLGVGRHAMTWRVLGAPGTEFTVALTDPASMKFEYKRVLDSAGKDIGLHWIVVE